MIVEVTTQLDRNEYAKAALKLFYRQIFGRILVAAGFISLILLLLQWFRLRQIFDSDLPFLPFFLAFFNILYPFLLKGSLEKHFDSSIGLRRSVTYIFDDEKLHYFAEGSDGTMTWEYLIKYEMVNNFLVLYLSNAFAYFIKTDTLTPEQIAFIQSKIKQP